MANRQGPIWATIWHTLRRWIRHPLRRPVQWARGVLLPRLSLWRRARVLHPVASSDARRMLGRAGEDVACSYLEARGYRIVARNVRYSVGEVDIVARDGETLVFVEVRTRRSREHDEIGETVTPAKQRRVTRAALRYLRKHPGPGRPLRFDVITVSWPDPSADEFTIAHCKGAFGQD